MKFFILYLLIADIAPTPSWASPIPQASSPLPQNWKEFPQGKPVFWPSLSNRINPPSPPQLHKVVKRNLWGPHFPGLREVWDHFRESPLAKMTPVGDFIDEVSKLFGEGKTKLSKGKLECWSDELWREHGGWCTEEGPNFPKAPDVQGPPVPEPTPEPSPEPAPQPAPQPTSEPAPKPTPTTATLAPRSTTIQPMTSTTDTATLETLVSTAKEEFNNASGVVDFTPPTGSLETWSTTDMMSFYTHVCIVDTEITRTFAPLLDQAGIDLCLAVEYFLYAEGDAAMAAALGEDDPTLDMGPGNIFDYGFANTTHRPPLLKGPVDPSPYMSPNSLAKIAKGTHTSGGVGAGADWLLKEIHSHLPSEGSSNSTSGARISQEAAALGDHGATYSQPDVETSREPTGAGSGGENTPGSGANSPAGHARPSNQGITVSQSGIQTSQDISGSGSTGGNDPGAGPVTSPDHAAPGNQGASDSQPGSQIDPGSAGPSGHGLTNSEVGADDSPGHAAPGDQGAGDFQSGSQVPPGSEGPSDQGATGSAMSANNPPEHAAPGTQGATDFTSGIETTDMTGALPPGEQPPSDGVTPNHVQEAPTTGHGDALPSQSNGLETPTAHVARQGRQFRRMNGRIHKLLNEVEECGYMHKEIAREFVKLGIAETPETMEMLGIPYTEVAAAIEGIKIFAELPYVPYSLPEGYCWRNAPNSAFGDHLEYFKRFSLRLGRDPKMYAMKEPPPTEWEPPAHLKPPKGGKNPWPHPDDEGVVNQVTSLAERPEFITGLLAYAGLEGTMITPEIYSQTAIYGRWWANTHGFQNRYFFQNVLQGVVPHSTKMLLRIIKSHRMMGGIGVLAAGLGSWATISWYQAIYINDRLKNGEPVREWQKPISDGDWPWITEVITTTRTASGSTVVETVTTSSQFTPPGSYPESMLNPWYVESLDASLSSTAPGDVTSSSGASPSPVPAGWYIPNPPLGFTTTVSENPDRTLPGDTPTHHQPLETGSPDVTPLDPSDPTITAAPSIAGINPHDTQPISSKLDPDSSTSDPPQQAIGADTMADAKALVFHKGVINVYALSGFQGDATDEPPLKPSISSAVPLAQTRYHLVPTGENRRPGSVIEGIFRKLGGPVRNSSSMAHDSSLSVSSHSSGNDDAEFRFGDLTLPISSSSNRDSNASQWRDVYWQNRSSSIGSDSAGQNASRPWTVPVEAGPWVSVRVNGTAMGSGTRTSPSSAVVFNSSSSRVNSSLSHSTFWKSTDSTIQIKKRQRHNVIMV